MVKNNVNKKVPGKLKAAEGVVPPVGAVGRPPEEVGAVGAVGRPPEEVGAVGRPPEVGVPVGAAVPGGKKTG